MNVDKDNFLEQFPKIKEKLNKATFIAFDEEMTGIFPADPTKRNSKIDDADSRFAKMTSVSSKFCIMQIGLCIFIQKSDSEYEVSPYNFLLFPSNQNADIVMSASTVEFHRKNNLDFQKWIYKGLPFVDTQGEKALEKKYNLSQESDASPTPARTPVVLTKPSDIEYLERNVSELRKIMDRPSEGPNGDTVVNEYTFEPSNAFLRRAVYEYLDVHCPASHYIISKTADQCVKVKKVPAIVKQDYDNFLRAENKAKFDAEMGFRLLFNELVNCKKPLVGHNCTFDLLFLLQWLDRPLETDLSVFKTRLNSLFPLVFDTKYVATSGLLNGKVFEDTVLESLYRQMKSYLQSSGSGSGSGSGDACTSSSSNGAVSTVSGKRKLDDVLSDSLLTFSFAVDSPGYETSTPDSATNGHRTSSDTASAPQFHDAGWDAYCTGLVFATELKMMQTTVERLQPAAGNKMFMMQSMYHMDLDPARPSSILKARGPVFYLYNFPADTNVPQILAVFGALGYRKEDLELTWVDGTSTFVTITGPLPVPEIDMVNVLAPKLPSPWQVETLAQFKARSNPATASAASSASSTQSPATDNPNRSIWSWLSYFAPSFTSQSTVTMENTAVGEKRRRVN